MLHMVTQSVKKVVGIEIIDEAVKDARHNAQLNGTSEPVYTYAELSDVGYDIVHRLY